jgi:flagellar biosynthesis protein FlhA
MKNNTRNTRLAEMAVPLMVVGIVVVMILPLPTALLDLFLAASIAVSILTLLTAMFVKDALEFSVFPALLLITTLFRLSLNVSSARLILLHGFAGKVIEAFGHVVVGGNLVVGLVVFLILVIIQFAVITAGAGRVSEVAARFTLDAMPGKQMAIDADLNAGLITDEQARTRRRQITAEADFYGAMDGASKFVKGDAIAAVVIVAINLLGGFAVGVVQQHMPIGDAIQRYALLSVGDGLVSQIPALLISIASGIVVTRAASEDDGGLGADVWGQLMASRRVLSIGSAAVGAIAILPGLPKLPFALLAGALLMAALRRPKSADVAAQAMAVDALSAATGGVPVAGGAAAPAEDDVLHQLRVEPLELELATDLLDLVDHTRGGMLLERVRKLRRQIALDLGLVVPLVRTRDNPLLTPSTYIIRVHGVEAGRGEAPPGCVLVLDDGFITEGMTGRPTTEPVFGLPAMWMPAELADSLEASGATVVDRGSVLVTHLAEVVRNRAADLLSRQDVQTLVDAVKEIAPTLAAEVGGADGLSIAEVQKVLRGLLAEGVPIRDLVAILEAVTALARTTRDSEHLLEAARQNIGPAICERLATDGTLAVVTLEPLLEHALLEAVQVGEGGSFLAIDPMRTEGLIAGISEAMNGAEATGRHPVLVCAQQLRPSMHRLAQASRPDLPVLSYAELSRNLTIEPIGVVNLVQHAAV